MGIISRLFGNKSIHINNPATSGTFSAPSSVAGCNITGASGGGGGGGAGVMTTTTTTNVPLIPSTIGNIPLGNSGNFWMQTGTSGASLSIGGGLSKEEREELNALKEYREEELKSKKIAEFKKLPAELRQFITNALTWKKESDRIGQLNLNKLAREIELETKEVSGGNLSWANGTITMASSFYDPTTPDGLSFEDIEQAHIDATLEEQVLNNE